MKPAWDQLMGAFKGHPTALVADVDCTAAGQPLCQQHGVQGYPSIKYGDPKALKDYQGGRDFNSLKSFADTNLGPKCGPDQLDACTKKKRKMYEDLMEKYGDNTKQIEDDISAKRKELKKLEEDIAPLKEVARVMRKKDRAKKEAERKAAKAEKKKKEAEEKAKKEKSEL